MKNLVAALRDIFGRGPRDAAPIEPQNDTSSFSTCEIKQVETEIVSSGPEYAFARTGGERIFVPKSIRLVGGEWWEVRPGRRVRLGVVRNRAEQGLRALGLTFLDTAASAGQGAESS